MTRPRIGVSMDTGNPDENKKVLEINAHYPEAVLRAGGMPVLLPHTHDHEVRLEMIAGLDGLLIPGGDDVDPKLYGQVRSPKTHVMDSTRQDFDLAMLALAEQRNMPTLGICLGCQLMNVQRRGSLYQSIKQEFPESQINHATIAGANATNSAFHDVTLRPGTQLMAIYGKQHVETNSRHRQAIQQLGQGLVATAFASDGILEAVEDPTLHFWIAVQWHPENLVGTVHEKLFAALVNAARRPTQ
jgi:putative glutamine amidotransferase